MADIVLKKKKSSPITTVLLFVSFGAVLLILFNPGLRTLLGHYAGVVFTPLLGFGGAYPLVTILLASIILVVSTTAIRHFLVDWVNMARVQEAMRSFQKEFAQARKDNNTYKLKKLTEAQPEILAMQSEMSTEQMKPMAFTMLLVIPIFAWLAGLFASAVIDATTGATTSAAGLFVSTNHHVIRVPWDTMWDLTLNTAPPEHHWYLLGFIPRWIVLYSLFGIPLGQIAQRALKLWEYRHHSLGTGPIVLKD